MSKRNNPPHLKSVAKVKGQVSQYVSSKETNKLVKEAILKELNSHLLSIKPQKIHHHVSPIHKASAAWRENEKPLSTKQNGKDGHAPQGITPIVERHGQISSVVSSKIPRLLKPSKKKGTNEKSNEQTRIQLYQNLPNYEWHKYGRINELKLRFLARKFSSIWVRNVFGRVPPQKARRFYEQKLMKNAFCVLEESWWKTRKGWKLNIRAEYHNRYRLWEGCFRAWRFYTCLKKGKKQKYLLATEHNEKIVLKKYLAALEGYRMHRIAKRKEKEKADAFHVIKSQRLVIQCWRRELRQSEMNKALEREALSWWALNLTSKAFARWKLRKAVVDVENKNMAFAMKYYKRVKLKQCLRVLTSYVYSRRRKLLMKEFAKKHYFERLKKGMIARWYLQLQHKLDVLELQDRIEFMSRKFILRTFFVRWQFYIRISNDYKGKEFLAAAHCNQKLKAKYLYFLFCASNLRKLKKEQELLAFEFRKKTLLSEAWELWLKRCDRSEELKIYPLTKIARSFQRKKTLKKFFANWCRYILWRRKRKELYAVADEHFKSRAMPKFFGLLYEYKEKRLEKSQRVLEANAFHRELMFAKYFYTWLKQSLLEQELRMQERIAVLHHEEISKRKILQKWRKATASLLEEQRKETLADVHSDFKLKDKYFKLLKAYVIDEVKRRKQERLAVVHDAAKKQDMVFAYWKKYTVKKRMRKRKLNVAISHYQKLLAAKVMHALKVYLAERREIHRKVERRVKVYNQQLLGKIFETWHQNVFNLVEERRKHEIAQNYANQRKMAEVFEAWRNYTVVSRHIQSEENKKVTEIRTALEKGKLQRAFSAMKEYRDCCRRKRKSKESATMFHENRLKTKYFDIWKKFRRLVFQKLLLQRNSEVFYVKVRMFHFFHKWKAQHKNAIYERNRNNVVLWFWSEKVKRKMFFAWKYYVKCSKRKKIRHTKALELRREFLLESCLQNWLKYSSDMIAFRAKMARHRQLEGAEKLHERVRRYALIWYSKTQKRQHKVNKEKKEKDHLSTSSGFQKIPNYGSSADEGSQAIFGKRNLMQNIPVVNKDYRMQPRRPAYLRDSFDLSELIETGAKDTNGQFDVSRDESRPRGNPPKPTVEGGMQEAPPHLGVFESAITLATSSDEDLPAKKALRCVPEQKGIGSDKKQKVVLMPPSSFTKNPITQISASQFVIPESRKTELQGEKSKASDVDCSPTLPDEDNASDVAELESIHSDFKSTQIFQEIFKIKEELDCYRKKQNYLKELKKRLLHISSWLSSETMLHDESELKHDIDFIQAAELKSQIENEIDLITVELNAKKPAVRNIATHVQTLEASLQI